MINNPTGQLAGYLQSVVELNPGKPETNPDQRLEWELNPGQPHPSATHTVQAPGYSSHPPRISARMFKRWINIDHLLNWAHFARMPITRDGGNLHLGGTVCLNSS